MRIRNGLLAMAALPICAAIAAADSQPTSNLDLPLPPPLPTLPAATQPATTTHTAPGVPPANPPPPVAVVPTTRPTPAPTTRAAVAATQPPNGQMRTMIITSNLDQQRDQISPSIGATTYTIGQDQIQNLPQGDNAAFQQVLLRAPGVVMDSYGQEHVRGEHGNLTYDINGVLLPEGLNGFGQELDTRLIQSVTLIDGSLPAQYGFHTAGIIDVTTKSGASLQSNEVSIYGGGYDTFQPSVQFGGTSGKWDYFVTSSYKHSDDGIENPTSSVRPLHDDTDQQRLFAYLSYHIDDTSRLSFLVNASNADFQIPDTPGVAQAFTLAGHPFADSSTIDENQNEQDYYAVASYQKTVDNLSFQASAFTRYGQIDFTPDPVGDLIFQGVAANVLNSFLTNGVQFDGSYKLNDQHTLRAGLLADNTQEVLDTHTLVFPVDPTTGLQTSDTPTNIVANGSNEAFTTGIYLQDEWRINSALTLNYGLRYDRFDANFDTEDQVSPRVNLVWKVDDDTTAHVGYSRYFVPPPIQYVNPGTVALFNNTTNAAANSADDPPKVERSDYFDLGVSHQITKPWGVNVDGFYKFARQLVDLGQFGDAVILAPYNYRIGSVYGGEISSTYKAGGFSLFGNFAYVITSATDIDSNQYTFDPDELAYISTHSIPLDHQSLYTASAGISYAWPNDSVYLDFLYGSGLRAGFANLQVEPQYYPINIGYQHTFHPNGGNSGDVVKLRVDVVNLFDESYQIRSGEGVGVNASQYGQRRTLFVGLAYDF